VLKNDQQLSPRLLPLALRANMQLGKIDRTEAVLEALNKVSAEENAGVTNILGTLAALIRMQVDELRKKSDKEGLDRAIKGYTTLLDKQVAKVKGEAKPDFIRVLAACYSSMGEHSRAAEQLSKIPDPRAKPGTPEDNQHKGVQLMQVRELRMSGAKKDLDKARELMDKMRGPDKQPGWARRNLPANMEHAKLLQAEEKWKEAFNVWVPLLKQLASKVRDGGEPIKEMYFDVYFNIVLCEINRAPKEERDKALDAAAAQIATFEKSWEDFGNETSKRRFTELLDKDPALKAKYEAAKVKKGKK
jgi:hypothetical protein